MDAVTPAEKARSIWDAGVESVYAANLIGDVVSVSEDQIFIGDECIDRSTLGRIAVVGCGKAGTGMTVGLEQALGQEACQRHQVGGWVNVPDGTVQPTQHVKLFAARPAGINEPTPAAAEGAHHILEIVGGLQPADLCITLISGGGSALMPAPRRGISLQDKLAVTQHLSGAGANIEQLNTVRKQLSDIKGGRLLKACRAGKLITLIISDVLGDPLDTIASGPTVPDSQTAADALDILAQFDPDRQLPASIYSLLLQPQQATDHNASCIASHYIIGNNATAVDSAGIRAEQLGFAHAMQSAMASEGQAEDVGRHLAKMTVSMLREPGPDCLISGGEPVVKLVESSQRGLGGRNQQLALAALDWLIDNAELTPDQWTRIALISGGTDGEDGPTDAAGAMIDAEVWSRCRAQGLEPKEFLQRNDAYNFFAKCGGLVKTGPTHTNVCDLRVITVQRDST